jgi:hypothetical protein
MFANFADQFKKRSWPSRPSGALIDRAVGGGESIGPYSGTPPQARSIRVHSPSGIADGRPSTCFRPHTH